MVINVSRHAKDGAKADISYEVVRGEVLDVPVLNESRWVYECEVERAVETGDIRNIQMDERLMCKDIFDI